MYLWRRQCVCVGGGEESMSLNESRYHGGGIGVTTLYVWYFIAITLVNHVVYYKRRHFFFI